MIGKTAQADQQGNEMFYVYTNPEKPFYSINSVVGEVYDLHPGEAEDTYMLEIAGYDMAYVIETAQSENAFDFHVVKGELDPAVRFTLAMSPFSQYK